MSKPRTAILWGQNDLLTQVLEKILTTGQSGTWDVIRLSANECISALVEQVRKTKPELVILYQAHPDTRMDPLLKLLEEQPELRIVAQQPRSRVITFSLEDNVMQVYTKQSIKVNQVSDVLSIIEDRYFSENPSDKEVMKG